MKATAVRQTAMGTHAGARYMFGQFFYPNMFREYLSVQNAHKVERGLRLQTAIKANKIDFRALLALPVTDHAHPYKMEFPWEKTARQDTRALSGYGKYYANKVACFYDAIELHKFGICQDDMTSARGWWNRAARTRCPTDKIVHGDRRVVRGRILRDKYIFDPKSKWVQPSDNTCWLGPYILMISDEWEEKWGFFAGQEVEY